MNNSDAIRTVFEMGMSIFIMWALFNEDKFARIERRIFAKIRRRRFKVINGSRVKSTYVPEAKKA